MKIFLRVFEHNLPLAFLQSSMVSPFSVHQQQNSAVAANSWGGSQTFSGNIPHHSHVNGAHFPLNNIHQSQGSNGYRVPAMMIPIANAQKHVQVRFIRFVP